MFDRLPPNTVVALYRIVQEAINNVVRHAQARRIKVRLGSQEGVARLVIEDDGRGLADVAGTADGRLEQHVHAGFPDPRRTQRQRSVRVAKARGWNCSCRSRLLPPTHAPMDADP